MADAEIIQLGARGRAGRGSRGTPSSAARGLAGPTSAEPGPTKPRPKKSGPQKSGPQKSGPQKSGPRKATGTRPRPVPDPSVEPDPLDLPVIDPAEALKSGFGGSGTGSGEETPADDPSPFDLAHLLTELVGMGRVALESMRHLPYESLRAFADDPLRGFLSLSEGLGVDWQQSLDATAEFIRTRMSGDYAIDEFGFDPEFTERIFLPVLRPLVEQWFRVEVRGLENIPEEGAALLVSNHAGTMPLDGMVLQSVVHAEMGRFVRMLGADLIFKTPYSHDLARKTGTTLACQEDAERLLATDQLVSVFPEGFKGLGKPYSERYKLQRFGRGGFVSAAVRAEAPIIPISIVGSEEIFPLLSTAPALARAMGVPYFPVTPLFPWFGVLGLIPLPSKWIIQIGEAITTDELPPGAADDPMVVFNVTDQVRETIQQTLYGLLMQRRSVFY
ncbi:MAG: 1-acyl-sn-glycerol-3-phosphate acyltransferase [Propionibacteriaceae bacterium]